MRNFTMTADDRRECVEALVVRFRTGEVGPVYLRAQLREWGFADDDIDDIRNEHIDACAVAMSERFGGV